MVKRIGKVATASRRLSSDAELLIALRVLGYPEQNPVYAKAEKDFAGLFVDDPDDFAFTCRLCLGHCD